MNCYRYDRKEEVFRKKLREVRQLLGSQGNLSDNEAELIIEAAVLEDRELKQFHTLDLLWLVDRLFLTTRSRLGILTPLVEDEEVTEIMVNGADNIFVEKNGNIFRYKEHFDSIEELEEVMMNIAGDVRREINELNPIVDARLLDGSRVNGVYKNIAINGPILTIRKFQDEFMRMEDLVKNGTVTDEGAELLKILVACGYNIFLSGGTSSGKTTFLNALAEAIPKEERVIVIEDSMELKLPYIENIVHMECRNSNSSGAGAVDMKQLIKSSLRMRPDRIIVGEVRGGEVLEMLNAFNTGHDGSLSSGHGNSISGMLRRLESMYLMAASLNIESIDRQIAEGIDIMIHLGKLSSGRRRIMEIAELVEYKDGDFKINSLMKLNREEVLEKTGNEIEKVEKIFLKGEQYASKLQELGFIK